MSYFPKKKLRQIVLALFVFFFLVWPVASLSQLQAGQGADERVYNQVRAVDGRAEFANWGDPQAVLARGIQLVLGVLAIVFLGLVLLASYQLIIARGREDKYSSAMATFRRAIVGFIIIMGSYGIVRLVVTLFEISS